MFRKGKIASFMALLLMLALVLPAFGMAGSLQGHLDPKKPTIVTLWHYYVGENQQALDRAVNSFNQTLGIEKGVVVETLAMGSIANLEEAITNSAMGVINSQPMPQIFSSYPDKAMDIDALGMVADINGYFSSEEKDAYVQDFLADGVFQEERLLLLPVVKSTELLYLNKTGWDAFADATGADIGDLATWEGVYETARAYYKWSMEADGLEAGKSLIGFDSVANYIIAGSKQLSHNVIDAQAGEGGQAVLNKDVLRKVFAPYYQGISLGYFGAVGRFRSDDIKSSDLIAYVGSSSSAAYFPTWIEKDNAQQPIEFQALAYPVFQAGQSYAIQQGAGMCVAAGTPAQQEGAVLFLKWFTDAGQNIPFAMSTGYLPVQTAAYNDQAFIDLLEGLRQGSQAQQNVATVYDVTLKQITQANTYAAAPFPGSYDVRSILQSSLIEIALEGRDIAVACREEDLDEDETVARLDVEGTFDKWIDRLTKAFDNAKISYVIQ